MKDALYEGKAKIIYSTENPGEVIQYFKDDATAFDGKKKGSIQEKGALNNRISTKIFEMLSENGVPSHHIKTLSEREMLVKKVEIIPVEFVVRNVIAGSLAKRMGMDEGTVLKEPIVETYFKDD
ncbi:MAG: phosphoribosylaminoimidazolesuccinocarboxamide synthase, partial [Nitrospinota bacterium]